jgi:allophanate hydrolase subunit 1
MGFAPGFAYMTGLPPEFAGVPRLPVPRPRVPAGAVAVAEDYCAVYPNVSPGGWNLIGWSSAVIANVQAREFLFAVGDVVVFRPEAPV